MKLYNLKDHNEQVSFAQAVTQGLGKNQGLFFPHDLPEFSLTEVDEMLNQDFVSRSAKILSAFIGDEIPQEILEEARPRGIRFSGAGASGGRRCRVPWSCSTARRWPLRILAVALWRKC
ncbi:threonine synthase [Citrobacter koseri]|uniref:Threonine synthase n=1 Tax=Citrobacter koseri TaxID=545 RepID=A0A3S4I8E7_CITKO|nr:threonine synthase [Citrobacter koseri]